MGKRRKRHPRTYFEESAFLNNALFDRYYNQLYQLSVTLPQWKNMPDSIDTRYMERALFMRGCAVFYKDEDLGQYLCLPATYNGDFDQYGIPYYRTAFGFNGYHCNLTAENSVLIFDNIEHSPLEPTIELMAYLMSDYDMTIKINANVQKTPAVLECDETERLTVENLFKEYLGNAAVIKGRKGISQSISAIQPAAPFVGPQLYEMKTRYWNEALTIIGVPNMIETHHQRQSTDEVYRDMGGILASQYNRLYMRKVACEQINRMFPDLDISVTYSVSVSDLMQGAQASGDELPDLSFGGGEDV